MTDLSGEALFDQALALYRGGRASAAARLCRSLAISRPDDWRPLHLLGVVALERGHPAMALRFLIPAARSGAAAAHASLAVAYRTLHRPAEALAEIAAAAAAAPEVAEYRFNLGNVLQDLHDFDGAAAAYRAAIEQSPDMVAAHWNLGLALLRAGRYAEGWPEYEWRWRRFGTPLHYRSHPAWTGEDFAGRTLLLYTEQGFGDAIQFSRYLPWVAGRGGRIVLECPQALARLFAAGFPDIEVIVKGTAPPPFDLQAALPSLPGIARTTLRDVPSAVPYLAVPADGPRLPAPEGGRTVGLVWASSQTDSPRNIPFAQLAPLLALPGVRFYSLQIGPAAAAAKGAALADLSPLIGDFADTAALLAQLDLVISVDTAVVHLAGALARPVWVVLPHLADWRWLSRRADSPWYPTATLFRQAVPGCWDGMAAALLERLQAWRDGRCGC